jgi:hypothetical protein
MTSITFEEMAKYFDMKLENACQEIKLSSTSMKKLCREFNIQRWPYRKLKSLYSKREKILQSLNDEGVLSLHLQMKLEEQLRKIEDEIKQIKTKPSTKNDDVTTNTNDVESEVPQHENPKTNNYYEPYNTKPHYHNSRFHQHHMIPSYQSYNIHDSQIDRNSLPQQPPGYFNNLKNQYSVEPYAPPFFPPHTNNVPIHSEIPVYTVSHSESNIVVLNELSIPAKPSLNDGRSPVELPSFNSLVQSLEHKDFK